MYHQSVDAFVDRTRTHSAICVVLVHGHGSLLDEAKIILGYVRRAGAVRIRRCREGFI
jgi:DNA-nicking Smr family endonuclease